MEQNNDKSPFKFQGQTSFYAGKVRDVYSVNEDLLIMIASDRVSAFDFILPRTIPCKGQILNQLAGKFLRDTTDILPNWVIDLPDPNVTVGWKCIPFKIEMVIRGYLAGHAWREYKAGKRMICGVPMRDGMKENDKFPSPLITPATKADEGHDEDISREDIIAQGIVGNEDYIKLENYTRQLFERGQKNAQEKGLILVDTKYEFGKIGDDIYLMDEIHTPDSSRYFYADSYEENQQKGLSQKQLSKEFVREWLMSKGFQGLDGQQMPEMSDDVVERISNRYIELYEQLIGEKFMAAIGDNREKEMYDRTTTLIDSIQHKRSESLNQN